MDEARRLLRHHFGHGEFRPAQRPVIASVLAGRDTLAVLPTGGGKSVCFQVPALVTGGLTLVVSPLIALMQDQVAAASARGASPRPRCTARHETRSGKPSGAGSPRARSGCSTSRPSGSTRLAPELRDRAIRPALLAVDEAHCITEWGHDFRPSYRTLGAARYRLGRPPAVALTGSATPEVRHDIARALRLPSRPLRRASRLLRPRQPLVRRRPRRERAGSGWRRSSACLPTTTGMVIVYAPTRGASPRPSRGRSRRPGTAPRRITPAWMRERRSRHARGVHG